MAVQGMKIRYNIKGVMTSTVRVVCPSLNADI